MGLREILTKPLLGSADDIKWNEPFMFRARVRGDFLVRFLFVMSTWAIGIGILLFLFTLNNDPPGIGLALGLGAVFGLGPGCLMVFLNSNSISGTIRVTDDGVHFQKTSSGFGVITLTSYDWEYDEIEKCVIIDGYDSGQPFDVMLVDVGEWFMLGISRRVESDDLARKLSKAGVPMKRGREIPERFREKLSPVWTLLAMSFGVCSLGIGATVYSMDGGLDFDFAFNNKPKNQQPNFNPPAFNPPAFEAPAFEPPQMPDPIVPEVPRHVIPFPKAPGGRGFNNIEKSELAGGDGGVPFERKTALNRPVVALQFTQSTWAGKRRLRSALPFDSTLPAAQLSQMSDLIPTAVARDGYAVGGIHVDGTEFINAVSVIFMKIKPDGTLDPEDSYNSPWLGTPHEKKATTISGGGKVVVGVHGRAQAAMDAIGLVYGADK